MKLTFEGTSPKEILDQMQDVLKVCRPVAYLDGHGHQAERSEATAEPPVIDGLAAPSSDFLPQVPPVPPAQAYTMEELSRAGAAFMRAAPENQQQLIELMHKLGVPSLMDLPEEKYQAFADGLVALGGAL